MVLTGLCSPAAVALSLVSLLAVLMCWQRSAQCIWVGGVALFVLSAVKFVFVFVVLSSSTLCWSLAITSYEVLRRKRMPLLSHYEMHTFKGRHNTSETSEATNDTYRALS